jgi:tetrahydromethanopterin S-methyltransferase subunit C
VVLELIVISYQEITLIVNTLVDVNCLLQLVHWTSEYFTFMGTYQRESVSVIHITKYKETGEQCY